MNDHVPNQDLSAMVQRGHPAKENKVFGLRVVQDTENRFSTGTVDASLKKTYAEKLMVRK